MNPGKPNRLDARNVLNLPPYELELGSEFAAGNRFEPITPGKIYNHELLVESSPVSEFTNQVIASRLVLAFNGYASFAGIFQKDLIRGINDFMATPGGKLMFSPITFELSKIRGTYDFLAWQEYLAHHLPALKAAGFPTDQLEANTSAEALRELIYEITITQLVFLFESLGYETITKEEVAEILPNIRDTILGLPLTDFESYQEEQQESLDKFLDNLLGCRILIIEEMPNPPEWYADLLDIISLVDEATRGEIGTVELANSYSAILLLAQDLKDSLSQFDLIFRSVVILDDILDGIIFLVKSSQNIYTLVGSFHQEFKELPNLQQASANRRTLTEELIALRRKNARDRFVFRQNVPSLKSWINQFDQLPLDEIVELLCSTDFSSPDELLSLFQQSGITEFEQKAILLNVKLYEWREDVIDCSEALDLANEAIDLMTVCDNFNLVFPVLLKTVDLIVVGYYQSEIHEEFSDRNELDHACKCLVEAIWNVLGKKGSFFEINYTMLISTLLLINDNLNFGREEYLVEFLDLIRDSIHNGRVDSRKLMLNIHINWFDVTGFRQSILDICRESIHS